jgi:hypothetical protein
MKSISSSPTFSADDITMLHTISSLVHLKFV